MRPLFLMFETDPGCYDQDYEYMFGDDLLVAPVLAPGASSWPVYLPPDTWVHLWTGDVVEGGDVHDTETELGYPPVFYRQSSNWKTLFEQITETFGI